MNNKVKNYNLLARVMHWISALTIFGLFGIGLWMVDLSYYSEWYKTAPDYHRSVGILLASVTIIRLLWSIVTASPEVEGKTYEVVAAKIAHSFMYLNLAVLFISGYLISTSDGRGIDVFNWFTVPSAGELFENQSDLAGSVHYYAAWVLIIMVSVHALAAIKHHVIDKDDTLRKIIGASK
jgi:cytochrome b561